MTTSWEGHCWKTTEDSHCSSSCFVLLLLLPLSHVHLCFISFLKLNHISKINCSQAFSNQETQVCPSSALPAPPAVFGIQPLQVHAPSFAWEIFQIEVHCFLLSELLPESPCSLPIKSSNVRIKGHLPICCLLYFLAATTFTFCINCTTFWINPVNAWESLIRLWAWCNAPHFVSSELLQSCLWIISTTAGYWTTSNPVTALTAAFTQSAWCCLAIHLPAYNDFGFPTPSCSAIPTDDPPLPACCFAGTRGKRARMWGPSCCSAPCSGIVLSFKSTVSFLIIIPT